jgi:tRNA-2-methylthio-N6-dimethylallyladenosine synthase
MKKAYIKTFGCQMNVHDSEKMAGILRAQGFDLTEDRQNADLIIFNTCSIRQKAEQKFLSELGRTRRMKERRPALRVAVAGCIAQQMGEKLLRRAPHVDYLFGPQNLHALTGVSEKESLLALEENPGLATMELPVLRKERGRAWVSIMYGCDNFCSYCIVPYTRGRERSRPSESIVSEVRALAAEGFREVTLLGQNVNSYRSDVDFPGLLRRLNGVDGLARIRFVPSHPKDFSPELVDALAGLEKPCEHVHLPLQSGSTRVLREMNRKYTREEYLKKVQALRARVPGVAITTDIITGFPGEREEDHRDTLGVLGEVRFDGIFAFAFSPRPGTRAAAMQGHLPDAVRSARLAEVLELQDSITLGKNEALTGTTTEVLVEGPGEALPGQLTGRTRTNKIVTFQGGEDLEGTLLDVRIVRARRHSLEGEVLSS